MTYLSTQAARVYMGVCRSSLRMGIIGHDTFLARLAALRWMCRPGDDHWTSLTHILDAERWGESAAWDADMASGLELPAPEHEDGETRVILSKRATRDGSPFILSLIPAPATGLHAWEFHKGDADPFPSIPHGHHRANARRKLDAFLGYIYDKNAPDGRVSREAIVRLWNDDKFRQFAVGAIGYFDRHHRDWRWRVGRPLRLPRKRR